MTNNNELNSSQDVIYLIFLAFSLLNRVVFSLRHKLGIAFDYSPRFDENEVVRNTYQDGKWGEEERSEILPFKRGALMQVDGHTCRYICIDIWIMTVVSHMCCAFQVTIICSHHQYEVFVNGEETHTYKHRYTKLEEIDVLDIRGDLLLTFVQP